MQFLVEPSTLVRYSMRGNGRYVNDPNSTTVPNDGPLPAGVYYIVDRESGGRMGWLNDFRSDLLAGTHRADWFALYRNALLRLPAAIALTIPIYLGLANSPLDDWFQSGAGWRALEPLFNMFDMFGVHGRGDILISTILAASFVIALALVWLGTRICARKARASRRL